MILLLSCQSATFSGDTAANPGVDPADSGEDSAWQDTAETDTAAIVPDEPLPVCINEWMAENDSSHKDSAGQYPDWIELHNPGTAAITLDGWTLSNDAESQSPFTFPADSVLAAGEFLLLSANDGGTFPELPFQLDAAGGELRLSGTDGRSTAVTWGTVESDFSIARTTDCCTDSSCLNWTYRGTPGGTNSPATPAAETLIPLGATWRYNDTGVEFIAWQEPAFDDTTWATGAAPLGYGDEGFATTVGYGPDPNAKYMTTWFRLRFTVANPETISAASLGVRRDDGVAVYLNGDEVLRANMPEGQLSGSSAALASMSGVNESAVWVLPLETDGLIAGENVLAVELHQHAASSSDAVMDAFLVSYR